MRVTWGIPKGGATTVFVVTVAIEAVGGVVIMVGLIGPVAGRSLPVAFKLAGRIIPAVSAAAVTKGGLFGIGWKGAIFGALTAWAGMDAVDALLGISGGDSDEARKVAAILSAIEDGLDSGSIFLPEPPPWV